MAQSTSRLGNAVAGVGQEGFNEALEMKQRQDEQQTLDVHTSAIRDLQTKLINPEQDENGTPKGFLSRNLNQAKGSTQQFDQLATQMKQQYVDAVPGTLQKQRMNDLLSASLTAARESVVQHEATQGIEAFKDSFKANQDTMIASAATLTDGKAVTGVIHAAQASAMPAYIHLGLGEAQIHEQNEALAAQVVKSAITSQLENDPQKAQGILDDNKHLMSPLTVAEMQNQITGKKLDQTILQVFDKAKEFRMADGMIDRSKVDTYVDNLGLNPQQTLQVKLHVDRLAMVDYSEQMKIKQDQEKSFANDAITAQSKGMPVELFMREAANPKYGNADPMTVSARQTEIAKLWASPEDRFNYWLAHADASTQHAWSDVQDNIKAKYGNTISTIAGKQMKSSDAALADLKEAVIGKSSDQVRQIADDKMKKVIIGPGAIWGSIWPNKGEAWKADIIGNEADRQGLQALATGDNAPKMEKLNQFFGKELVSQAYKFVQRNGKPITPENIKDAIQAISSEKGWFNNG